MFGKTYGKITLQSATKDFHKGADLPPSLRYASTTKDAFISQQNEKKRQEVQLMQTKNNKGIHVLFCFEKNFNENCEKNLFIFIYFLG